VTANSRRPPDRSSRSRTRGKRGKRRRGLWWEKLTNGDLLDVRICDLDLSIDGTALESRIQTLHDELDRAGLSFRPHVWLSSDWFTPDGVIGFAVPFFLAHPRLARIEHQQMFEVEGGTHAWCMKLLRHETGHAIDNAYRLHWKKRWRETFGRFSERYDFEYIPNPASRHHVQHLGYWYSQSHPAEDFAETFAVWLRPGGRWRALYHGWPVLRKLEFVAEVMQSIGTSKPVVKSRARPESLSTLRMTLREYYADRKQTYVEDEHDRIIDSYLIRLFSDEPAFSRRETAAAFLRRFQTELRNRVAYLTRQPRYLVEQAIDAMVRRCRTLGLRVMRSTSEGRVDATILITILTMHFVHDRRTRYRR
jgi:hypothetical protein